VRTLDVRRVHLDERRGHRVHQGEPSKRRYAGRREHPGGRQGHQREDHRAAAGWAYPTTTSADRHRVEAEWACQTWRRWAGQAARPAGGRGAGRRGDQVQHQRGAALTGPEHWKPRGPKQPLGEQPDAGARRRWAGYW